MATGAARPSTGDRRPRGAEPPEGPLAALVELLLGTHLAPAELIPTAVDGAARFLGVGAVAYVVDYGGSLLVPMPDDGGREPLPVGSTLAGRAYRLLQTLPSSSDGVHHLWVPIIDGIERVGVLDLLVQDAQDLEDPALRRQSWWFSHFLGHLINALDQYGDGVDKARRRRPRSTEAELIWNLLPPLTAGTDKVVVSGRLEPSYDVGGDVFDYALSPTTAWFGVLDATGHDLSAGLAAAAALAAYRSARRNGKGLFAQTAAVDRTLADQFRGDVYATAVFGELDLESGRLRYLVAGHPEPLVLRDGRIVKQLAGGRRPLLGLHVDVNLAVAEEYLQPGDTVVLFTDGIPEARDSQGQLFGIPRLTDILERETLHGMPLPEVVDRLVGAVLEHQGGVLQDDATLMLVQWTTEGQAALEPAPSR